MNQQCDNLQQESEMRQRILTNFTSFAKSEKSEDGFEMIVKNAKQVKEEVSFFNIPAIAFPKICGLLGEPTFEQRSKKKPFKIYSMFYVDPMNKWTGVWDFILIFVIYFFQVMISLQLAFGPDFWKSQLNSAAGYIIGYIVLLLFLCVDVVICFHKGYYAFGRGKVNDDHEQIIKHYLKIHFPIDISAILLLIIPLIHSEYFLNYLQIVPSVLLYIKKAKNERQILDMLQYHRTFRNVIELSILGCDVMLIGHYGACIFVGLDLLLWRLQYYGNNSQYYWLSNDSSYSVDLIGGDWILQYVFAQSFSTGTLSTLAPGPFGKNPIQIFYAIILMTFFMILASYVGQVLVSILYTFEETRIFHENNIERFDQFMKLKGVSAKIKRRVHNFFELIWEVEGKMSMDKQKQILDKLPLSLKEELLMEMGFAKNLKIFNFFTNGNVIQKFVSFKITSIVIDSETVLFFSGQQPKEIDQRYLYYIKSGICKFFLNSVGMQQKILALSNIQKIVGQFEFVTGLSYSYSCRSIDLCTVDRIANSDFLQIVEANGILEEYHVLKYRLLIQNELQLISKSCIICDGNHIESKCTELNYSEEMRESFREKGGIIEHERRTLSRKKMRQKKVVGKDENLKFSNKALIPSIWSNFTKLGQIVMDISKVQENSIEIVKEYKSFYPHFNA